jgi:hypothetical protein
MAKLYHVRNFVKSFTLEGLNKTKEGLFVEMDTETDAEKSEFERNKLSDPSQEQERKLNYEVDRIIHAGK